MSSQDQHKESFISKYIFSQDHKWIGIQYGFTSLVFLLFGFALMMIMRWQLAYPDTVIPFIGGLFENGMLSPDMYNSFGAMHGTIMIFLDKIKDTKREGMGYEIACAQLCGNSHYRMKGYMTVESMSEYEAWLEQEAEYLEEEGDDDW